MKKFTIKGAFADRINLLQHRQKELKKIGTKTVSVEVDANGILKADLIELLKISDDYSFEDGYLHYNRPLTDAEKQNETNSIKGGIEYDISRLKKWIEQSDASKRQILSYLDRHNIKIEGINQEVSL